MKQQLEKNRLLILWYLTTRVEAEWHRACNAEACRNLYGSMRNRMVLCIQINSSRIRDDFMQIVVVRGSDAVEPISNFHLYLS